MHDISIIKKWIQEGEGSRLDFKTTISSRPKIAKNIVAFANSRGGKLVVGIEDKGFVVGVDFEGEKYELEKAAKEHCSPSIKLKFSKLNHQGKIVLIAEIEESKTKPHYSIDKNNKQNLYVRIADACVSPPAKIKTLILNGELNGLQRTYDYEVAKRRLLEYLKSNKELTAKEWSEVRNISETNAERFLIDILLEGAINMKEKNKEMYFSS